MNNSRLIRFLTENGMMGVAVREEDVGHQLGHWLNFRQAIALHKLLGQTSTPMSSPLSSHSGRGTGMSREALRAHVDKVRTALEQSILQGAAQGSGLSRIDMPLAELVEPIDPKTAFEPYRRFMASHQRQMEAVVSTLRQQVRGQLSQLPAMQTLSALDAQFESVLNEREALLLGQVAKLLEKRFVQALKQHLKNKAETPSVGDPVPGADTTAWLMPLRQALRAALLAELDTRLQPTLGLLEAYNPENPS